MVAKFTVRISLAAICRSDEIPAYYHLSDDGLHHNSLQPILQGDSALRTTGYGSFPLHMPCSGALLKANGPHQACLWCTFCKSAPCLMIALEFEVHSTDR